MKKRRSIVIAMLLVITFMLGAISPILYASAAEENTITYVSFGDSMTNGYGLGTEEEPFKNDGYLNQISTTYPALFSKYLENKYKKQKGTTVVWKQLAVNGMRIDELYCALQYGKEGAYHGDDLTSGRFQKEEVAMEYQTAVKEADYITLALGSNNLLRGFFNQTLGTLEQLSSDEVGNLWGGSHYDFDLEGLLFGEDVKLKEVAQKVYNTAKTIFTNILKTFRVSTDVIDKYMPIVEKIASDFVYSVVGMMKYYKATLDYIFNVNKNVTIISLGISNTLKDVKMTFNLNGMNGSIDLGDVTAKLMNICNHYIASLSIAYSNPGKLFAPRYKLYYTEVEKVNGISSSFGKGISMDARTALIDGYTSDMVQLIKASLKTELDALGESGVEFKRIDKEAAYESYDRYVDYCTNGGEADPSEIFTLATYEAIEKAIVLACRNESLDINSVLTLIDGMDSVFSSAKLKQLFSADNVKAAIENGDLKTDFIEPLSQEIIKNKTLMGLLMVYGKYLYSNGMGIHPSEQGQLQYYNAVVKALEKKETGSVYFVRKIVLAPVKFIGNVIEAVTSIFTKPSENVVNLRTMDEVLAYYRID